MYLSVCRRETMGVREIEGVAVCEKYVCAVLSDGTAEVYSMPDLFRVRKVDLGARDVYSACFSGNEVLFASLTDGLVRMDLETWRINKEKGDGVWRVKAANGNSLCIYSTAYGSEVRIGGAEVFRSRSAVFAAEFGSRDREAVVGTEKGAVLLVRDGKIEKSLVLSKNSGRSSEVFVITQIRRLVGEDYAVSTQSGEVFIVDMGNESVKQVVQAREGSSLNAMCVVDEKIYVSGADSRVLVYIKAGNGVYARHCQHDTHVADILCMAEYGDVIVTGGADGVVNSIKIDKLGNLENIRRYQDAPSGCFGDKMFTCDGAEITVTKIPVVKIDGKNGRIADGNTEEKEECRKILKHIVQRPVLSIECAEGVSAVRTGDGVKVYRYDWSEAAIEILCSVRGRILAHAVVGESLWYLISKKNGMFLEKQNIEGKEESLSWGISECGISFVPTEIKRYADKEVILCGEEVGVFSEKTGRFRNVLDCLKRGSARNYERCYVMGATADRLENVIFCVKNRSLDLLHLVTVCKISKTGNILLEKEIEMPFSTNIINLDSAIAVSNQKKIAILSSDDSYKSTKYVSLGAIIDHVTRTQDNNIVAIQGPWTFAKESLPPQVKKTKFGRK